MPPQQFSQSMGPNKWPSKYSKHSEGTSPENTIYEINNGSGCVTMPKERSVDFRQNVTERISERINAMQEVQSFCLREGLHYETNKSGIDEKDAMIL